MMRRTQHIKIRTKSSADNGNSKGERPVIGVNSRSEISLAIMNNCTCILFLSILHVLFYCLCRLFVVLKFK